MISSLCIVEKHTNARELLEDEEEVVEWCILWNVKSNWDIFKKENENLSRFNCHVICTEAAIVNK